MTKRKTSGSGCLDCERFVDDPESLETIFKNLRILCSAYASVRGDSGLCSYDDRFRLPRTACEHFRARS
jgi:hypothetical protein